LFPVFFDVPVDTADRLKAIKEQLRSIPARGIGFGLLRHLTDDPALRDRLTALPSAQVSFNYLGQFDTVLSPSGPFRAARGSLGATQAPDNFRQYLLDVTGMVSGGCLRLDWHYSDQLHRRESIETLAQAFQSALEQIISHCRQADAGGVTPSDFPLVNLDQAALKRISAIAQGNSSHRHDETII
jgi:non-ribosomal peptide synthase protein (TIGR01720 family)